jgi:23S rRNA pseudouridine1911/1915/1917 synthase
MAIEMVVGEELKGRRVDVATAGAMPALSRAYVRRLVDDQRVLVNNQSVRPGYRLRLSDTLTIDFDTSELDQIPDIDLPVIYEDENVLVVNKPAGIISHARGRFWNEPSVASFVRQKTGLIGERAGIVHRLDRATSGVMICAKNTKALAHLQKQFSDRSVKKTYLAIVEGQPEPPEALIDAAIERHPARRQTFRTNLGGRSAVTYYRVVKNLDRYSAVRLVPKTGRTHQLRVHMAFIKHPVVGDELYGARAAERLYLHAAVLAITLPGGQHRVFRAKKPAEFLKFEKQHATSQAPN